MLSVCVTLRNPSCRCVSVFIIWFRSCRVTKLLKQVAPLQKAAANRVSRLAESDASLKELVDAGVVHKLLAMLKPEVDEGT